MFARSRKELLNGHTRAAAWAVLLVPLLAVPCLRCADDPASVVHLQVRPAHDRQTIHGFGGSLAYWGLTDRTRECAPVERTGTVPAESVTTLLYNVP